MGDLRKVQRGLPRQIRHLRELNTWDVLQRLNAGITVDYFKNKPGIIVQMNEEWHVGQYVMSGTVPGLKLVEGEIKSRIYLIVVFGDFKYTFSFGYEGQPEDCYYQKKKEETDDEW